MQHFTAFFFIILAAKSKNDFDTFDTSFRVIYNALFTQDTVVFSKLSQGKIEQLLS